MDLQKAWAVLGRDVRDVKGEAAEAPDLEARIGVLDRHLGEARRTAKKRMAENHPDRNPGDPDAARRFREVQAALTLIEGETDRFRKAAREVQERRIAVRDGTVVIG